MDPKKGIKESEDVIKAVEVLADKLSEVLADGKVSIMEMGGLLLAEVVPAKEALEGASAIASEMRDLDQDEVAKLAGDLFRVLGKMVAVFAPKA